MRDKQTWELEDHLCKACGGRILRCATGAGITPGGNPVFKCADCGRATSGMSPDVLCWCGFSHHGNHNSTAYVCQPFTVLKDRPELEQAFRACGCDPSRGEVGIMLKRDLRSNGEVMSASRLAGEASASTVVLGTGEYGSE